MSSVLCTGGRVITRGYWSTFARLLADCRTRLVSPIVDVIWYDSFGYKDAVDTLWGGFNWLLVFRWDSIPEHEEERRGKDPTKPIQSVASSCRFSSSEKAHYWIL